MFRLFRRRKKDKKKDRKQDKEEIGFKTEVSETTDSSSIQDSIKIDQQIFDDTPSEDITYAERITAFSKAITEAIPEPPLESTVKESEIFKPILDIHPMIKNIVESENSIQGFVSPEFFLHERTKTITSPIQYKPIELTPITLEEKIEGAMFSIGRPIHTSELIENLQEDSTLLKRTLRKLSKTRKKTAPIILQEISKDRWVLQLNPIYHEFFYPLVPKQFMTEEERRIVTEIAYRQPISLGMLKKIVKGIGPIKINEICHYLEKNGYVNSESRARSVVYTTTPKFAHDFGFDDESRRLKLQMLWRLKRLMGDYEEEEEEEEEIEISEEETEEEIHDEEIEEEDEIKEIEAINQSIEEE